MKKLIVLLTASVTLYFSTNQLIAQQTDSTDYLIMKVSDAILDCPHFQGLFIQMAKRNNWKEVERNLKERYLIYAYPSNVDYDIIAKFKEELNNMHFPIDVITDLYTKPDLEESKKNSGN